jgi:hypothetical protein
MCRWISCLFTLPTFAAYSKSTVGKCVLRLVTLPIFRIAPCCLECRVFRACLHWLYSMSVLETWCASLSWICSSCLYSWSVRVSVFRICSRNLYSRSIREPGNPVDTLLGQVAYIPDLVLQDRVPLCPGLVHEVYIQGPKWQH